MQSESGVQKNRHGKNRARRDRLHMDWPISVIAWRCWLTSEVPQDLWDTAKLMQQLWNDLCEAFDTAVAQDVKGDDGKPLLSKDERKAVYAPLELKALREIGKRYNGLLPSDCYYTVVDRFLTTFREWRKSPKTKGAPRKKFGLQRIAIPIVFHAGQTAEWLGQPSGNCWVNSEYLDKTATDRETYLRNGFFRVGVNRATVNLHVARHTRQQRKDQSVSDRLPSDGRIKRVTLVGSREQAFAADSSRGWKWEFQVTIEHPKLPAYPATSRVAGLDVGWRVREDGLRIGVLVDNAGRSYELYLPFAFGNRNARRRSEFIKNLGAEDHTIADWRDLWEWQRRLDGQLENCKASLSNLPSEARTDWPEEARRSFAALRKMRAGGLRRLLRTLAEAGIADAAMAILSEWNEKHSQMRRWIRGQQLKAIAHRQDHYRKIADWIAKNFDVIAWEGKLNLKEMAETVTDEYAIEAGKTYRVLASIYLLRSAIAQAMSKRGRQVIDGGTSYSTTNCAVCGGKIESSAKLILTCENGHANDQDINAGRNLLGKIQSDGASTALSFAEIPVDLTRYVKVLA
jgi:hypothetical protein